MNCFSQSLSLERYSAKDGYLDETLYKVTVDSMGRLVIFSRSGISVYNGKEFITNHYPDGTFTMASNFIITSDNGVHISEVDGKLLYKNHKFYYKRFSDTLFEFISSNGGKTSHGYPLLDHNGDLYFWCEYLYYYSENKFAKVDTNKFKKDNYYFYNDQKYNLYLDDKTAIYLIDKGRIFATIKKDELIKEYLINNIFTIRDNVFFVLGKSFSYSKTTFKILQYNKTNKKFRIWDNTSNSDYDIVQGSKKTYFCSNENIISINEFNQVELDTLQASIRASRLISVINDKWAIFKRDNFLVLYDLNLRETKDIVEFPEENTSINSFVTDNENNIWITTTNSGLFKISINNIRTFKNHEFRNENGNLIYIEKNNNRIYVKEVKIKGKSGFELIIHDIQTNSFNKVAEIEGEYSFIIPRGDSILVFTERINILQYIRNGEKYNYQSSEFNYEYSVLYKNQLSKAKVVLVDSMGNFISKSNIDKIRLLKERFYVSGNQISFNSFSWLNSSHGPIKIGDQIELFVVDTSSFFSYGERLFVYDKNLYFTTGNKLFVYNQIENAFVSVFKLPKSDQGKLASDRKIYKIKGEKYLVIDSLSWGNSNYFKIYKDNKLISSVSIKDLCGDSNHKLYESFIYKDTLYFNLTRLGLFKFYEVNNNYQASKCNNIFSQDGSIINDQRNLIIFSKFGIDLFSDGKLKKYKFGIENFGWSNIGCPDPKFMPPSTIYLFSKNKLTIFSDDSKSAIKQCINKTHLINVQIESNNESILYSNLDSILSSNLTVDYQTDITIKFSYSNLSNGNDVFYKYSLNSPDTNWHIQRESFLKLISLEPGIYQFCVKGAIKNGPWSQSSVILKIIVNPPWYRSNWAYGAYLILGISFVFVFIKGRTRKLEREKRVLEFTVQERTSEVIKQKEIVEHQKHLVEEKHKEITDSINYAQRIQKSFLATKELLNDNLEEYFVFFQPKDVVSGDFYWASKLNNGQFALVTADSTGHGVPGAIMSLLNITSLEKAIETNLEPAEILNVTRKIIIERLKKDGSAEGGKDGMDCSLISFDFENNKLIYAAANNPVWIVRENNLLEFAPDKMPVGKHDKDSISFTQHEVELRKGDVVYALTDGMPDQFGGPRGKKYMYKQLKELLVNISGLNMQEQKAAIKQSLDNWKGDLEQVDDICIIGVKV